MMNGLIDIIPQLSLQIVGDQVLNFITNLFFFVAIYILITTALNIQYGYTGIPNFGLAFGVAIGAYATGYFPIRILYYGYFDQIAEAIGDRCPQMFTDPETALTGVCNIWITMEMAKILENDPMLSTGLLIFTLLIAILAGALMGLLASLPAIRLRVDFLMMSLIAIAEGVRIIGMNYQPIAGGTLGIQIPSFTRWMENSLGLNAVQQNLILITISTVVAMTITLLILRSPYGRLLKAIRESEDAALAVGIDINRVKIEAMVVGTALAAFAGSLYSMYSGTVLPTSYTRYDWTFWPWLMLLMGGRGSELGAVLGATGIMALRRVISVYKHTFQGLIPFDVVWLERIAMGIAFLLVMIYRPYGLIPEKPFRMKKIHTLPEVEGYQKVRKEGLIDRLRRRFRG